MNIEIINKDFILEIYGFSGTAVNKDYAGTAFKLMDKMWQVVKAGNIKHKGKNIWVYEAGDNVFAGVEPEHPIQQHTGLELKKIHLIKYAYYKHTGPYSQLPQAGRDMNAELKKKGYETGLPYIEIYGHWTADETKLETELLTSLK